MSEKEHYGYNDLYDTILADTTPKQAVQLKKMVQDIISYRFLMGVGLLVAGICIVALFCASLMTLNDYMGVSEKPTDWPLFGYMFIFLGCGAVIGYIFAGEDHLDRIKRRVVQIIDDSVTEGDKE